MLVEATSGSHQHVPPAPSASARTRREASGLGQTWPTFTPQEAGGPEHHPPAPSQPQWAQLIPPAPKPRGAKAGGGCKIRQRWGRASKHPEISQGMRCQHSGQPDTQPDGHTDPTALPGHLGGSEQLGEQGVGTPSPAMRGHGATPRNPLSPRPAGAAPLNPPDAAGAAPDGARCHGRAWPRPLRMRQLSQ